MNREVHVRFWESVGLRCPTPLTYLHAYKTVAGAPFHLLAGKRRIRPTSSRWHELRSGIMGAENQF